MLHGRSQDHIDEQFNLHKDCVQDFLQLQERALDFGRRGYAWYRAAEKHYNKASGALL